MNMERPQRKPNRIKHFDYSRQGAYFITLCTRDREKILSRVTEPPTIELLPHGEIADKYIRQMDAFYPHLSVEKYVIMPDHVHLLITIHEAAEAEKERTSVIARFVGTFKRFCDREYGENIWQARYYDHVIRNEQDYRDVWQYIENNPYKKEDRC